MDIALDSLQSLENNPDDAGHIIRIHFRVSKVMDCFPSNWLWYCLDLLGITVVLDISKMEICLGYEQIVLGTNKLVWKTWKFDLIYQMGIYI